jgi:hypothetical protein
MTVQGGAFPYPSQPAADVAPKVSATSPLVLWLGLRRAELVALIFIICALNAMVPTVVGGVVNDGLVYSVSNTFEVSAIVWMAYFLGVNFCLKDVTSSVKPMDKLVAALAFLGCLVPLGAVTWILLSAIALYTVATSRDSESLTKAGWIYLAITVPMFWSKRVFNLFSDLFLAIDASLVSRITHTERTGNLVAMPGGEGFLQIAAPCSSMANVSLAILCWVLFTQGSGVRWRPANILWCAFACASVVAINVTRISLIGFYPHYFQLLHGPIGSTVVSWLTVAVVLAICYFGVKRDRLQAI